MMPLDHITDPSRCHTLDDIASLLRELRATAGQPPFRVIAQRVNAARRERRQPASLSVSTVHETFRDGRKRVDRDLVLDIATVLGMEPDQRARLEQACAVIAGHATEATQVDVRATLPPIRREFTGRASQLRQAGELIRHAARGDQPARLAVTGPAGIGKTEFALRLAHRAVERNHFPDTRLFVDLHGFDPDRRQAEADAVVAGFLRLLGLSRARIAGLRGEDAKVACLREQLSGRQALIVLDNARDLDQVFSLLPVDAGHLVIITSRSRMADRPGVEHISLDTLDIDSSVELLRQFDIAQRVDSEKNIAKRLAANLCYGVPFDLVALGGQLADPRKSEWTLADHETRLARFRADEVSRPALSGSYEGMDPLSQRAFRYLGALPGYEFSAHETAVLLDISFEAAVGALDALYDRHLLRRHRAGTFHFHDIARAYSGWLRERLDPASQIRTALQRLQHAQTHPVAPSDDHSRGGS